VEIIAAILLPVAILMCVYSLTVFIWRSKAISKKQVSPAMHHYSCQDCHHHHCVTVITVLPVVTVTDTRSALQCMHHMSGFEFQLDKKFGQRGCKDFLLAPVRSCLMPPPDALSHNCIASLSMQTAFKPSRSASSGSSAMYSASGGV